MFFGDFGGRPSANVDTNKFYNVLGVSKDCTDADLKKAYRKLAMKHHPDKGGDTEIFQEIGRAYEVLSNPDLRRIYDQGGEEALEGQGATHHDGMDIFDMFFGGGGRTRSGNRKTETVVNKIVIPLESIYTGITKKLAINKDVICSDCNGRGGPADKFKKCTGCEGRGVKVRIQRVGPMISQQQMPCNECRQKGESIDPKFKCRPCDGNGLKREKKILEVYIPPGCEDGKKIVFEGESDQKPGYEPGDVIVHVSVKPHSMFRRQGSNLFISKDVAIVDILCGFQFDLKHLDNRRILVRSEPCMIKSAKEPFLVLPNEGLPINGNLNNKGDLIIECNVMFPDSISPEHVESIRKLLPPSSMQSAKFSYDDPNVYVQNLTPYDASKSRANYHQEEEEEDERAYGGAQNVQCATQ